MNSGICPHCKTNIFAVVTEQITLRVNHVSGSGGEYNGVSYVCPSCHCVLGVSVDPVALKRDAVQEIVSDLRPEN